ncbi:hypothetical protein L1987_81013 [Smallanthus sonchifolius]|uniref:Uncharacterized protein n=1 Tax=Smallanthus sonchifolius TaxID=185202 RepID=A0ACB8YQC4_9ASTR|nr:hypothetical protein L1987_81013 [Smallanthus sonchifolius]
MTMVTPDPPLYTEGSRPMIDHDDDSSHESNKQQDRANYFMDQPTLKARHRSIKHYKPTIFCRDDRLLHYISCIRFGSGKFKCWWHDPIALCLHLPFGSHYPMTHMALVPEVLGPHGHVPGPHGHVDRNSWQILGHMGIHEHV